MKIDGKSKSSTTMMKEMAEAQCRVYQKEGCVWGIQSMIQRIAIKVYLSILHKIKLVYVAKAVGGCAIYKRKRVIAM